jgi:predicted aspartyl protease
MAIVAAASCGGAAPARSPPLPPPQHTSSAPGTPAAEAARPAPSATPATAPASASRHASFHWELKGKHFPLPLVRGTVAGKATWMLVDTGANSHVVAGWLARQVGLPLKRLGDLGSDHAGRTIATFRVDHPQMAIDDWGAVPDGPMLATEVPPLIEELGIGAFVSPQRLVDRDSAAIVLDFVAGEMRQSDYEGAVKRLGHHGTSLAPNGGRVCEDNASPIQGLAFVLPGTIEGRAVDLLVDTGAQRSDLLASSAGGKALAARSVANKEQLYAASGRMTSRTVKRAAVTVGDYAVRTDVDLIPGTADPYCPRDGVVSMDVLRACVLVLGKTALSGRCSAAR